MARHTVRTSRRVLANAALAAIAEALDVPRNRFGKLETYMAKGEALRQLAVELRVPGARDTADQARLVALAVLSKTCPHDWRTAEPKLDRCAVCGKERPI